MDGSQCESVKVGGWLDGRVNVCMFVCLHMYVYVCMYVCVCMYDVRTSTYVCVCVYVCVCMYV